MRRRDLLGAAAAAALWPRVDAQTAPAAMRIQRLAWAGLRVEVGATTVFVDAQADARAPLAATTPNRYALVTHHHGDHFDAAGLQAVFNENSYVVCTREVAGWLNPRGLRVQAVELHEPVILSRGGGEIVAFAVPAVDGFGHPQSSWVVDGGGLRIFHGGDTLWHGHWWDIARAYGPFDIAFLPINGFRQVAGRYTDTGVPMGLTPQQAVAAARVLKAKVLVPIHYGEPGEHYVEVADPEGTLLRAAREAGVRVQVVKPGDMVG